jgi:hypothetical protein
VGASDDQNRFPIINESVVRKQHGAFGNATQFAHCHSMGLKLAHGLCGKT